MLTDKILVEELYSIAEILEYDGLQYALKDKLAEIFTLFGDYIDADLEKDHIEKNAALNDLKNLLC